LAASRCRPRPTIGIATLATVKSMPDDLYEKDILAWSEHQAALLRRVAASETHPGVDWSHIIDEITTVGIAQLNDARGLLRQAMICLLRMHLDRNATTATEATLELECVLEDAAEQVTPSMTPRLNLDLMWFRLRAGIRAGGNYDDQLILALPDRCPWTVDALLTNDHDRLLAVLAGWPVIRDYP